jgi:hypothetical protein
MPACWTDKTAACLAILASPFSLPQMYTNNTHYLPTYLPILGVIQSLALRTLHANQVPR